MTALVPASVVLGSEVVAAAPAGQSPVRAQRLSALEDLLTGYLASKRSVATRTAYRTDLDGSPAQGTTVRTLGTPQRRPASTPL